MGTITHFVASCGCCCCCSPLISIRARFPNPFTPPRKTTTGRVSGGNHKQNKARCVPRSARTSVRLCEPHTLVRSLHLHSLRTRGFPNDHDLCECSRSQAGAKKNDRIESTKEFVLARPEQGVTCSIKEQPTDGEARDARASRQIVSLKLDLTHPSYCSSTCPSISPP